MLSTFLFPGIRQLVDGFVDRVVLKRGDSHLRLDEMAGDPQGTTSESDHLNHACRALATALSAVQVSWEPLEVLVGLPDRTSVVVPTTEAPHYLLRVGRLAGGRRLLSGDHATLARVAASLARRIDTLRLTRERFDRVLREREMRSLATEAELRALRAQINPHFLFNALTTISYLIQEAPARAVTTLMRLTTLLRAVLKTEGEFTTLRRETELIRCYLDIERERFEERLDVAMAIPDALADIAIPGLIVQPLVENAIKHGIAASVSGGKVSVTAHLDTEHRLCVSVRNTGAPLGARPGRSGGGVGLRNVEQRLASYYGQAGTFTLATTMEGDTMAEIRLPIADMVGAGAVGGTGRRSR